MSDCDDGKRPTLTTSASLRVPPRYRTILRNANVVWQSMLCVLSCHTQTSFVYILGQSFTHYLLGQRFFHTNHQATFLLNRKRIYFIATTKRVISKQCYSGISFTTEHQKGSFGLYAFILFFTYASPLFVVKGGIVLPNQVKLHVVLSSNNLIELLREKWGS